MGSFRSLQGSLVQENLQPLIVAILGGCMDNKQVGMLPEIENTMQRMDDLRDQIGKLAVQVGQDNLNWQPFEANGEQTSNSMAVLVAHVCGAEHFWIAEVIGGKPPTRDRQAEFATKTGSHTVLFHLLHQNSIETREILSELSSQDLDGYRMVEGKKVPVRWAILHIIDHTALHLGHMQMTCQMLNGGTPVSSPQWNKRIP